MYFQIFWQNYCRKTIEATTAKKVPNERELIYAIYNFYCSFLVSVVFVLQPFKYDDKFKWYFGDVNFSVNGNRVILLKMYVRFKRDLLENQNNLF